LLGHRRLLLQGESDERRSSGRRRPWADND
jgi:hypothetical protein